MQVLFAESQFHELEVSEFRGIFNLRILEKPLVEHGLVYFDEGILRAIDVHQGGDDIALFPLGRDEQAEVRLVIWREASGCLAHRDWLPRFSGCFIFISGDIPILVSRSTSSVLVVLLFMEMPTCLRRHDLILEVPLPTLQRNLDILIPKLGIQFRAFLNYN